jgi:hypothetical protein
MKLSYNTTCSTVTVVPYIDFSNVFGPSNTIALTYSYKVYEHYTLKFSDSLNYPDDG